MLCLDSDMIWCRCDNRFGVLPLLSKQNGSSVLNALDPRPHARWREPHLILCVHLEPGEPLPSYTARYRNLCACSHSEEGAGHCSISMSSPCLRACSYIAGQLVPSYEQRIRFVWESRVRRDLAK